MVTHYSDMTASAAEEANIHENNHSKLQRLYPHLAPLNACNFAGQHFEIINNSSVSNARINYAWWLRCTCAAVALTFLTTAIDGSQLFLYFQHRQIADATFWRFTLHCLLCIDLDKERTRSVILKHPCSQRWMVEGCEEGRTLAADRKHWSSRCTQTTVSSHHSQRPQGLECACEWGAYFVFLGPDSHPWGTFHPEMCFLLFSAPLYVSAQTIKKH